MTKTWETQSTREVIGPPRRIELGLINSCVVGFEIIKPYTVVAPSAETGQRVESRHERVFIRGSVKWDGCSDIEINPDSRKGYLHFCGLEEGVYGFCELMRAVYDEADALLATQEGT